MDNKNKYFKTLQKLIDKLDKKKVNYLPIKR